MITELRRLLIAVGYFTRIPIPAWVGWSAQELNRAARYFPLVGVAVGLIAAIVLWTAAQVLPTAIAVALSMLATLLLTGAFHEDGLADSADGFGGGHTPQRVLEIMRDSRIGAFGAIALVITLLIKFAALGALANISLAAVMSALLIAHAASRACALAVMSALHYVREEDQAKAKPVAQGIGASEWGIGISLGLLPLLIATATDRISIASALTVLAMATATTLMAIRYFRRRIGGFTGDCLGATQQVAELAIYLALCTHLPPA